MRIGFIGLGTMGGRIAYRLLAAGHELAVHDLLKERASRCLAGGARWADSPAEAASGAELVFTSLPGPQEMEAVAGGKSGIREGIASGAIYVDLTTNDPSLVRRVEREVAERGAAMLDAPVSGGPKGAESGHLAIWVGGDSEAFRRCEPVLRQIGDRPVRVGEIGAGTVAKLVHNCAGYAIQTAIAEAFAMGVKAGVEPLELWKAVREGFVGRRRTFDGLADQFLPCSFDPPAFALRLAHKDVGLAVALGRELGVPMPLSDATFAIMGDALERGWGERDSRVSMLLEEERAGVMIRVPTEQIQAALREKE